MPSIAGALLPAHVAAALLMRMPALGGCNGPVAIRVDPIEVRERARTHLLAREISLLAKQLPEHAMATTTAAPAHHGMTGALHRAHAAPARPFSSAGVGLVELGAADIAVTIRVEPLEQGVRAAAAALGMMLPRLLPGYAAVVIAVEHSETTVDMLDHLLARDVGASLVARTFGRLG